MSMLDSVKRTGTGLPPRIVVHAASKWGKTSFAAHARNAIFAMTNRETGLETLLDAGLVPPVAYYPEAFNEWEKYIDFLRSLLVEKHEYLWFVTDTGNGLERLCFEFVNRTVYGGDWGAFGNYAKGYDRSMVPWQMMLDLLDELRSRRNMGIILLHHSKTKDFNDPAGKSWNQWVPEGHEKLTGLTMKWADVIAYGGSEVSLAKESTSGDLKPTGTVQRYLFLGQSPSMTSGTRYDVPDKIVAAGGAKGLWAAFGKAINDSRNKVRPSDDPPKSDSKPPAEEKKPASEPAKSADAAPEPAPDASDPKPEEKPAEKKPRTPRATKSSKLDLAKDWYGQDFLAKYDVNAVREFAEAIERLQDGHYDFFTAHEDHPDVREFVREKIKMSDMAEDFTALRNDEVQPAAAAVLKWFGLGKAEPTPAEFRPRK